MNNTIILLKAETQLSAKEFEKYSKGDKIWGIDSMPEEIRRWPIEQVENAREKLKKYRCRYDKGISTWSIEEYALEFCECDEYGEFVKQCRNGRQMMLSVFMVKRARFLNSW